MVLMLASPFQCVRQREPAVSRAVTHPRHVYAGRKLREYHGLNRPALRFALKSA